MDKNSVLKKSKNSKDFETFSLTWNGIAIQITWEPNYCYGLIAHLSVASQGKVPLPISETGYRSHFCHEKEIVHHGGPVAYVLDWMRQESYSKVRKAQCETSQVLTLF